MRLGAGLGWVAPPRLVAGYCPRMRRWEYATIPLLVHATKQILDTWGEDGWELVTVVPGPNPDSLVGYLKRPLPDPASQEDGQ